AVLGRLPVAMVPFSLLLCVQQETRSYAIAGTVSASVLVGIAVGSVVQGRLMDRSGPARPLLVAAVLFAVLVARGVGSVESRASAPALAGVAFGIGVCQPTVGSSSRAMWIRILPPGPARKAALMYEAIATEVYFVLGPALCGLLMGLPWRPAAFVASGA